MDSFWWGDTLEGNHSNLLAKCHTEWKTNTWRSNHTRPKWAALLPACSHRRKYITVSGACGTLHAVRRHDRSPAHAGPLGTVLCVRSTQRVNWKIYFNLNYWNKKLQEPEIKKKQHKKKTSSTRSSLIGKSFLQGILMVLREDCKMKLMSCWW